ncbi:hypothetical protein L798_00919 [Zootermopsis nevadensis]|uniref:Uncharacterized protein n=1 Tax=Zootermopsis nevadensis TaxID=136037 RepID=A0A067QK24_ZOONE|nr:hypothetical protein L798_00919 [Zootermopsis nevadensis]
MAFDHGSSGQSEASGFPFSQDDTPAVQHKHSHISGKPLSARRGPGRPRKDKPSPRSAKKSIGLKLKGWKRTAPTSKTSVVYENKRYMNKHNASKQQICTTFQTELNRPDTTQMKILTNNDIKEAAYFIP